MLTIIDNRQSDKRLADLRATAQWIIKNAIYSGSPIIYVTHGSTKPLTEAIGIVAWPNGDAVVKAAHVSARGYHYARSRRGNVARASIASFRSSFPRSF